MAESPLNLTLPTRSAPGGFAEGASSDEATVARADLGFSPGIRWPEMLESEPTPTYIKHNTYMKTNFQKL